MADSQKPKEPSPDTEYWNKYLTDVDKCHLPQSPGSNNAEESQKNEGQQARQTVKIHVGDLGLKVWNEFCASWNIGFQTPFKAIWSMVLGRYLGADSLGFFSITKLPGDRQDVSVVRVLRDENAPLHKMLEELDKDARRSLPHQKPSLMDLNEALGPLADGIFNSMVIVAENEEALDSDNLAHKVRIHYT